MKISDALDQYRDICGYVINRYATKLNKSYKTVFIKILLLYMVIPRKINFANWDAIEVTANNVSAKTSRRNLIGFRITC